MNKLFKKIKSHPIITAVIVLLIVALSFLIFGKKKAPEITLAAAKKGTVVQEVSVTGQVKPAESVDLSFEKTGKISAVYIDIGTRVRAGQILAALSSGDIAAQLAQAKAGVDSAKAKLEELKKGSRAEDIQIARSDLKKTQQDLVNYYNSVPNILNDSYSKADDAVRKQISGMFTDAETTNPSLSFVSNNFQAQTDTQWQRVLARDALNSWKSDLQNLQSSADSYDKEITLSKKYLAAIRTFLNRLSDALQDATNVSASTLDTYKTNLNTAKSNISTALTNILNQEQLIASQKVTVEKYQSALNLKLAGSTAEQIAAQQAAVNEAEANVQNYQAQLDKTILPAPFAGIITKKNIEKGGISSLTTPAVSLISDANFEIEAKIPEADIAKIKIYNTARITLDAYGNSVVFDAKVTKIDPAETMVEGVATYKTTLQFIKNDDKIKSGMTANIDILANKKENVLIIPRRAIKNIANDKIVKIQTRDGSIKEVSVQTGLQGSDGNVEITGGLNEGDKVVISQ